MSAVTCWMGARKPCRTYSGEVSLAKSAARKSAAPVSSFLETIAIIKDTKKGQEASMYGPIRDLFCDALGYPRSDVVIDIIGEGGRRAFPTL